MVSAAAAGCRGGDRRGRPADTTGVLGARLAAAEEPLRYVALGDSSAAGPGIPDEIDSACRRSNHNWPHVLAEMLGAALTDVTCTGATTASAGPQLDALRSDTELVTLAIGANDVNLGAAFVLCPKPTNWQTCEQNMTTRFSLACGTGHATPQARATWRSGRCDDGRWLTPGDGR